MKNSVGQGFGPSGSTSQPCTRSPVLVRERPRHERPAGRGRARRGEHRLLAPGLEDDAGLLAVLEPVPDAAVRPDAGAGEAARAHRQGLDLAGLEVEAVEVVPAVAELVQQHGLRVGPPVGDLRQAIPRERQVDDLAGLDVPDRRRALAAPLVADREPRVARDRRPGEGAQRPAFVAQVGDDGARARVEDPKRRGG